MLKKILYTLVLLLVLGYLVWAFVFFGRSSLREHRLCTGVEIEMMPGNRPTLLTKADVRSELQRLKFNPTGQPLDSVNLYRLKQQLLANKLFKDVIVFVTPEEKIFVRVRQNEPYFLVVAPAGAYFVTAERSVMPYSTATTEPLLTFTGSIDTAIATGSAYDLAKLIYGDKYWTDLFAQVYTCEDSSFLLVPRIGHMDILLGKSGDLTAKFDKLRVFIDSVVTKTGWDAFKSVNLDFQNQVVAKPSEAFAALQENNTETKS